MVCIKSSSRACFSGGSGWGDLNISLDPIYERRSYYIRFDDVGDVWVYKDKVHPPLNTNSLWEPGFIGIIGREHLDWYNEHFVDVSEYRDKLIDELL